MKTALERYLDIRFQKVKQTFSANWGGDNVWIIYSEDGITNSVDGIYIHKYDNQNYVLVHRYETEDETITNDIFYYTEYENSIRELVSIDTIRDYIWNSCKHTHNEKDFQDLQDFTIDEMYKIIKGI